MAIITENRPVKVQRDADTVLRMAGDVLKDPKASRDLNIMVLRYTMHIVGDIHQAPCR